MSGDNIMEFGFDDAKVIENQSYEQWKQAKKGERSRISIISFKRFHDVVLAAKQREKVGADGKMIPLTDQEKAEFTAKIDAKLAQQLGKPVEQLAEVDRLDIKQPRFKYGFTHFSEGVGTIRCLSKYEGSTLVKPDICCDKFHDAEQTVAMVVLQYPVDDELQVDDDLLKAKKYTTVGIWKMGSKKFRKLETAYVDARNDKRFVIDLSVVLDGDPKYQGQVITSLSGAYWAREGGDPAVRAWVLDQGLRAWKHVDNNLGFEMSKDKLLEKLNMSGGGSHAQIGSGDAAEQPKLIADYSSLIE